MTANELIVVARLADHYEKQLSAEHDPLEVAEHDFQKFKRDAPKLWGFLRGSNRSDRQIGDWLYAFLGRYKKSGTSLKNFAVDELEQLGGVDEPHHATKRAGKKSAKQIRREVDEFLQAPKLHHAAKQQVNKRSEYDLGTAPQRGKRRGDFDDAWDIAMDALLAHQPKRAAKIARDIYKEHGYGRLPAYQFSKALRETSDATRREFEERVGPAMYHEMSRDHPTNARMDLPSDQRWCVMCSRAFKV